MKRKFYFLRDFPTGEFYIGGHVGSRYLNEINWAAVYYQLDNAKKKAKKLIEDFERINLIILRSESGKTIWSENFDKQMRKFLKDRRDLPNWGVGIFSAEIDSKGLKQEID